MHGSRKILMISDHSDPLATLGGEEAGGQNVYVDELSSWLSQKGHTVHVITRQNSSEKLREELSPSGYTVFRVPLGSEGFMPKEEFVKFLPEFTDQTIKLVQKHNYDVIHSHYWLSGIAAIGVKKEVNIPVVHTFHSLGKVKHMELKGLDPIHAKQREVGEMKIVKAADCLLAESSEERRLLLHYYKADAEKITVIPAGVDTSIFTPGDKTEARKKLDIPEDASVVFYVGRFVAQKGVPNLVKAFAQALQTLSKAEQEKTMLVLAGGSLDEQTIKQSRIQKRVAKLIDSLHIADKVRVVGQVENEKLPTYYQAADMTVVPSKYEPFGIVPLEAMACGTPVVASFVGGMKSTVRNLYTGLHARPNSSADIGYKISLLIKNPELRREFGVQARHHIEKEYSWDSVCDRILICYNANIAHV